MEIQMTFTLGELSAIVSADASMYNGLKTDAARIAAGARTLADWQSGTAKLSAALDVAADLPSPPNVYVHGFENV